MVYQHTWDAVKWKGLTKKGILTMEYLPIIFGHQTCLEIICTRRGGSPPKRTINTTSTIPFYFLNKRSTYPSFQSDCTITALSLSKFRNGNTIQRKLNQPFRTTITCSSVANWRATASIPNVPELQMWHIRKHLDWVSMCGNQGKLSTFRES